MDFSSLSEEEWREKLGEQEYRVLRTGATEAPYTGIYTNYFESGRYFCKACGSHLFDSEHKFDSHCGWPAFDRAKEGAITYFRDSSFGMIRTETKCATCDSHLGHVFDDGPQDTTGRRYCINSICLDFSKEE